MSFIIKTAKTVEEAIEAGLLELGVTRDQAEIEVLEEPKSGFLGLLGQKDAMVKIKEKEDISSFVRDILYDKPEREKPAEKIEAEKEKVEATEKIEVAKEEVIKEPVKPVEKTEVQKEELIKEPVKPVEKIEVEKEVVTKTPVIEEEDEDELEESNSKAPYTNKSIDQIWSDIEIKNSAEEFLTTIINEFGIKFDLDIELKDNDLKVDVKSPNPSDLGIIIGKHGSTLDSLQYLLSQVVNKHREEFIRVNVDANKYRDKRMRSLERLAKRSVDKVLRFGRPIKLEPMNAADRRIVHMFLQDYENITTHSEGRDPFRRVVITKIKK